MHQILEKADPATFEIVKNGFYKIAEEMRVVLAKTAYSPLLKSAGDYSCGLFDAAARWWRKGPTCRSTSAPCPMRFAPSSPRSRRTCTTATFFSTTILI